jgi:hypothetical protein
MRHSFTAGVKRRGFCRWRRKPLLRPVILFDIERIEPRAIMPDGVIQKMRVVR